MSVIAILIAISLGLALLFLCCFIWAVRSGQYEDTLTPAMRILAEEPAEGKAKPAAPGAPRAPVPISHASTHLTTPRKP